MTPRLRAALAQELELATAHTQQRELAHAFHHLERAHVLSQGYAWPHLKVHVRMLVLGLRKRDGREVLAQLARIVLAVPGSWLRRAPRGNTGGSNVGIFTPMAIPDDLLAILSDPN